MTIWSHFRDLPSWWGSRQQTKYLECAATLTMALADRGLLEVLEIIEENYPTSDKMHYSLCTGLVNVIGLTDATDEAYPSILSPNPENNNFLHTTANLHWMFQFMVSCWMFTLTDIVTFVDQPQIPYSKMYRRKPVVLLQLGSTGAAEMKPPPALDVARKSSHMDTVENSRKFFSWHGQWYANVFHTFCCCCPGLHCS